jgi:hypothetical protein
MAGPVPPAGPKPLRRGEGPAIHVLNAGNEKDVDARIKSGHDEFFPNTITPTHGTFPFPFYMIYIIL